VLVNAWPIRLASRDAIPRTPRGLGLGLGPFGFFSGDSDEMREARVAFAAYLRNVLWWTQKASLRISEPGLPYRRTLISNPSTASAGELRNGNLFARKAGVENSLANGVLLRM
jgi:hypothetical protein